MLEFHAPVGSSAVSGTVSPSCVRVDTQGNLLSALAFLQGLAAQELSPEELAHTDERYDVTITVKAVKPIATEAESLESLRS